MTRTTSDSRPERPDTTLGSRPEYPDRLSAPAMAATLSRALADGIDGSTDDAVVFYDFARLASMLDALNAAFPPNTLHAVAIKANPAVEVLRRIRASGYGAEAASMGELKVALAAGFPVGKIVFDSPVKTREELKFALGIGVGINANCLEELDRIASLYSPVGSCSRIGIRINPEIGRGTIDDTSVAVQDSKFGVSLRECRSALTRAFSEYPWLNGLHVHIGSQGMSREQLVEGVGTVYDFWIEAKKTSVIDVFDIGGGLPAKYRESETPARYDEYAAALRARCPELFTQGVTLVTEFGRSIHASCAWVAARVEYVVANGASTVTLLVHVGADMFVRKAYRPDEWHHDISVCDSAGKLRTGPPKLFQIAGPLCFAGDYLGRNVSLPADVIAGDYLLIHDAGAYTFSMWSMYNSRQFPAIIGYEGEGGNFHCIRRRQSADEIVAFWS